jgi:hypothetical protein
MDLGIAGRNATNTATSRLTTGQNLQLDGGSAEGIQSLIRGRRPTGNPKLRRGFAP